MSVPFCFERIRVKVRAMYIVRFGLGLQSAGCSLQFVVETE